MKFQAVIFDLDGTLLDTLADLADSMNFVLNALGFPGHAANSYKYFVGEGVESLARKALPEKNRDELMVKRCVEMMRREYGQRHAVKTHLYDGIPELLDKLAQWGIPYAVLSNKPDDLTQIMVKKFLNRWSFKAISGHVADIPRKPDPAGALAMSALLQIPQKHFIFLGDSGTDMHTAVAAGMFPAGACWGFRTADELLAAGAEGLFNAPGELLDLF